MALFNVIRLPKSSMLLTWKDTLCLSDHHVQPLAMSRTSDASLDFPEAAALLHTVEMMKAG